MTRERLCVICVGCWSWCCRRVVRGSWFVVVSSCRPWVVVVFGVTVVVVGMVVDGLLYCVECRLDLCFPSADVGQGVVWVVVVARLDRWCSRGRGVVGWSCSGPFARMGCP